MCVCLLRFTSDDPCWTEELFARAGEDAGELQNMAKKGLVVCGGGVYTLTEEGARHFDELAAESFFAAKNGFGARSDDEARRLAATTRLRLALERGNVQQHGLKDYRFRPAIEVRPKTERTYALDGGRLRWLWCDATDGIYPQPRAVEDRSPNYPDAAALAEWKARYAPDTLTPDLLFLCRYDFSCYTDFAGHVNDAEFRLINSDRFFFYFADGVDECLNVLGKYHLWLSELRGAVISGYLDIDTLHQDSVNWLIFVTEGERDAERLAGSLREFGDELTRPAAPMEVRTLSLEALENYAPKQDVIWELLPFASHSVSPARD